MAMSAETKERFETQLDVFPPLKYLEALDEMEIYGHMGRKGEDRNIRLTPQNVELFDISRDATVEDIIENKPELTLVSTALIVDRLKSIKEFQEQCPDVPKRALAFFVIGGIFVDQVILEDIREPREYEMPHKKHTAFFQTNNGQDDHGLIPVPVGKIYTPVSLSLPR